MDSDEKAIEIVNVWEKGDILVIHFECTINQHIHAISWFFFKNVCDIILYTSYVNQQS